jgi:hypothetical protein
LNTPQNKSIEMPTFIGHESLTLGKFQCYSEHLGEHIGNLG